MIHRDLKPANAGAYLGQRRPLNTAELDRELERGKIRHDEGEDRRGRWGLSR
jgi:hypothetical protein